MPQPKPKPQERPRPWDCQVCRVVFGFTLIPWTAGSAKPTPDSKTRYIQDPWFCFKVGNVVRYRPCPLPSAGGSIDPLLRLRTSGIQLWRRPLCPLILSLPTPASLAEEEEFLLTAMELAGMSGTGLQNMCVDGIQW